LLTLAYGKDSLVEFRPIFPIANSILLVAALVGLVIGAAYHDFQDRFVRDYENYRVKFDQIYVPVERERRLQLLKACLENSKTYIEKKSC
jgi:hypothetical protein